VCAGGGVLHISVSVAWAVPLCAHAINARRGFYEQQKKAEKHNFVTNVTEPILCGTLHVSHAQKHHPSFAERGIHGRNCSFSVVGQVDGEHRGLGRGHGNVIAQHERSFVSFDMIGVF